MHCALCIVHDITPPIPVDDQVMAERIEQIRQCDLADEPVAGEQAQECLLHQVLCLVTKTKTRAHKGDQFVFVSTVVGLYGLAVIHL